MDASEFVILNETIHLPSYPTTEHSICTALRHLNGLLRGYLISFCGGNNSDFFLLFSLFFLSSKDDLLVFVDTITGCREPFPFQMKNSDFCRAWWCMPLIPKFVRQGQAYFYESKASLGLQSKFHDNQENPVLKNKSKQQKNQIFLSLFPIITSRKVIFIDLILK